MGKSSFFTPPAVLLFFLSLFLNLSFFYCMYENFYYYTGYRNALSEIAYNFYAYNSTKVNLARRAHIAQIYEATHKHPEYYEINPEIFGEGEKYSTIELTPWYGVLLGSLWKLTGSLSCKDIVFLQIILFSFCLIFIYNTAFLLFNSREYAFIVGIFTLLFFPLTFHNIAVLREIWPFYGTTILLWALVSYIFGNHQKVYAILGGGILLALGQLIRPQCFSTFLAFCFVLSAAALFSLVSWKKYFLAINTLVLSNIACFWIPFMAYNMHAYNRLIVSPTGQASFEGFGEQENEWGYECDDEWYAQFMKEKFNLDWGTPEAEDITKKLVINRIKENPFFYLRCLVRRIPQILIPSFPWFSWLYNDPVYDSLKSLSERVKYLFNHCFSSRLHFLDFIARQIYIRSYILLGYIGFLLMILQGYYFAAFLLLSILMSSWFVIFIHVEYRYILYTFGCAPYGVAYLYFVFKKLMQKVWTKPHKKESSYNLGQ